MCRGSSGVEQCFRKAKVVGSNPASGSMDYNKEEVVSIVYTNYRGETNERKIVPKKLWFGSTEYHKEKQWLLDAFDMNKKAERTFAITDIKSWEIVT